MKAFFLETIESGSAGDVFLVGLAFVLEANDQAEVASRPEVPDV